MPAEDAVGLSPLSRHATHRSKADIPDNSDVDDGAAERRVTLCGAWACAP